MNFKIATIIICAIICALIVVSQWTVKEEISPSALPATGKAKTEAKNEGSAAMPDPESLKKLQPAQQNQVQASESQSIKDVIKRRIGDDAAKSKDAMEAFLKTWNPMGRSAQEVKEAFGKPSVEKTDSLTYMFDNGFIGWNFEFVLKNSRVVELRRPEYD